MHSNMNEEEGNHGRPIILIQYFLQNLMFCSSTRYVQTFYLDNYIYQWVITDCEIE